jgi:hypothetical protein
MLRLTRVRIPAESCDVTQLVSFLPPRLTHSGHPQLGPRWRDDHQPASEMVWQSPLVVAKPPFPDDDPRWRLPGYNRMRKKEQAVEGAQDTGRPPMGCGCSRKRPVLPRKAAQPGSCGSHPHTLDAILPRRPTREHLFKYCHRWKDRGRQFILWRVIGKATGGKRTARNTVASNEVRTSPITSGLQFVIFRCHQL